MIHRRMRHPSSAPLKNICLLLLSTLPLLAGCAAQPALRPTAQTSPLNGRMSSGTVVAVRAVNVSAKNTALSLVLTSLGQPPASDPPPAQEVIIRRQDSSIVSVVETPPPGQPAFAPGTRVSIAEAAATVVRPQ